MVWMRLSKIFVLALIFGQINECFAPRERSGFAAPTESSSSKTTEKPPKFKSSVPLSFASPSNSFFSSPSSSSGGPSSARLNADRNSALTYGRPSTRALPLGSSSGSPVPRLITTAAPTPEQGEGAYSAQPRSTFQSQDLTVPNQSFVRVQLSPGGGTDPVLSMNAVMAQGRARSERAQRPSTMAPSQQQQLSRQLFLPSRGRNPVLDNQEFEDSLPGSVSSSQGQRRFIKPDPLAYTKELDPLVEKVVELIPDGAKAEPFSQKKIVPLGMRSTVSDDDKAEAQTKLETATAQRKILQDEFDAVMNKQKPITLDELFDLDYKIKITDLVKEKYRRLLDGNNLSDKRIDEEIEKLREKRGFQPEMPFSEWYNSTLPATTSGSASSQ